MWEAKIIHIFPYALECLLLQYLDVQLLQELAYIAFGLELAKEFFA